MLLTLTVIFVPLFLEFAVTSVGNSACDRGTHLVSCHFEIHKFPAYSVTSEIKDLLANESDGALELAIELREELE